MTTFPKIEGAPGLIWLYRKTGWVATWQARTDLAKRGFRPRKHRILPATTSFGEEDLAYIIATCQRLQSEMLVWSRGGLLKPTGFDGTVRGLIDAYQSDKDSRYHTVRYATRENQDYALAAILKAHGDVKLADIRARTVLRWHEEWKGPDNHVTTAHNRAGMLRSLVSYGATLLDDDAGNRECERLCGMLHKMKFEMPKSRKSILTAEHAIAVRAMARKKGFASIALAQALQFELTLRQKDVIGEWIPVDEKGMTDIVDGHHKWLRGVRWSSVDENMVLTHITSKRQKEIVVRLDLAPMVVEELRLNGWTDRSDMPKSGPIIVSERTGKPFSRASFRQLWRRIANAAGIPREVCNMDSRAGAITEATDSGATLEDVRHAATHSNISTTQIYSRGSAGKVAKVMEMRVKNRKPTP